MKDNETANTGKKQRKRPPRKPPSWDVQRALSLAKKGVGPSVIASACGVHRTTVSDYLKKALPEFKSLQSFRNSLGDSLTLSLANYTLLEHKLLALLDDEDLMASLKPSEKTSLLARITIGKAICYDKWRLQTNQSTSNNSHSIQVNQVHKALDFRTASSESTAS